MSLLLVLSAILGRGILAAIRVEFGLGKGCLEKRCYPVRMQPLVASAAGIDFISLAPECSSHLITEYIIDALQHRIKWYKY